MVQRCMGIIFICVDEFKISRVWGQKSGKYDHLADYGNFLNLFI